MAIVKDDVRCLDTIERSLPACKINIIEIDVNTAIKGLTKKKAYDEYGICAEHLQHARHKIVPFVTKSINCIIQDRSVPQNMKTGKPLPIPKKGKDQNQTTNLCGLTISPIFRKIIDRITLNHQEICTKK